MTTKLENDPKSEAARALARRGVRVWTHDRLYALVRDENAPHGWRLVASATTLPGLLAQVERVA